MTAYDELLALPKKKEWDLGDVKRLLEATGNPQKQFKSVIVAGTNGKGSITAMISSILSAAGLKVGSYYSPHVDEFGERIQVDGEKIGDADLERIYSMLEPFIEEQGNLSFFEVVTAIAFHHFAEQMADYAILEAGMGGRLDAVNAADPLVSVVATVDLEHTDVLGTTLGAIAGEKVAVLRKGGVLVTMEEKPEALDVFRKACATNRAELLRVGINTSVERVACTGKENKWRIKARRNTYSANLRLLGEHQGKNAAAAILAVEALKEPALSKEAVEKGLAKAFIPARLEVTQRSPSVVMDAAHNPAAMRVLAKSLKLFKYDKLILVIGMMADKDIPGTVKEIAPSCSKIICNKPSVPRAADAEVVAAEARKHCKDVEIIGDVRASMEKALSIAGENDLVLLAGSIYMVSEARGKNTMRLDQ